MDKGVEMVGPKKREMSGVLLNYFYSVGEALVGLLFWLYPNWVVLQLLVSVPPLLFIGYYWLVPESVRWLLARKDYTKAKILIRKAARVNGVELSDHVMQSFELKSPTHSANVINISFWQCKRICRNKSLNYSSFAFRIFCGFAANNTDNRMRNVKKRQAMAQPNTKHKSNMKFGEPLRKF